MIALDPYWKYCFQFPAGISSSSSSPPPPSSSSSLFEPKSAKALEDDERRRRRQQQSLYQMRLSVIEVFNQFPLSDKYNVFGDPHLIPYTSFGDPYTPNHPSPLLTLLLSGKNYCSGIINVSGGNGRIAKGGVGECHAVP